MPWDSRQFGIFQLWLKYYETPSSVIMDENVLRKRKIRGGERKALVSLKVCLKRRPHVLFRACCHPKAISTVCLLVLWQRRTPDSNKCHTPTPSLWELELTCTLTGFFSPQGLCSCCALYLKALPLYVSRADSSSVWVQIKVTISSSPC